MKKINYKVVFTGASIAIAAGFLGFSYLIAPSFSQNYYMDVQLSDVMKEYLDRASYCDEIMEKNQISEKELERLLKLKRHDVLTFKSVKEVEQELSCQAVEMSTALYLDWLLSEAKNDQGDIRKIVRSPSFSSFLRGSISLTAENKKYISEDSIRVLESIDFFKKPFRLENGLLESIEKD